jgi:hypothetical protein
MVARLSCVTERVSVRKRPACSSRHRLLLLALYIPAGRACIIATPTARGNAHRSPFAGAPGLLCVRAPICVCCACERKLAKPAQGVDGAGHSEGDELSTPSVPSLPFQFQQAGRYAPAGQLNESCCTHHPCAGTHHFSAHVLLLHLVICVLQHARSKVTVDRPRHAGPATKKDVGPPPPPWTDFRTPRFGG